MTLAILLLEETTAVFGWRIRLSGLLYSQKQKLLKEFPKFSEDPKTGELAISGSDSNGDEILSKSDLPISFVTKILKNLEENCFKVVGNTSTTAGPSSTPNSIIWTLSSQQ